MATKKKLLQAAAGAAGGAGLNIEDVFSTYLYTGNNGSNRDISNGIDLSTEGGMVWWRPRDNTDGWGLIDTERGAGKNLRTHGTFSEYTDNGLISAFNTDGYRIGGPGGSYINSSSNNYVSFSFRKAPKFFDVVTYTGNSSTQSINHSLGSVPACIIVKATSNTGNWVVYHRGTDATSPENKALYLNLTNSTSTSSIFWNNTAPTSSDFTVGNSSSVNISGQTYIAYLFAHNDGDGDFGSTADQDIIKCGSWTASSTSAVSVDLGFEPQWVLVKRANGGTQSWLLWDTMRGMPVDTGQPYLQPNLSSAESTDTYYLSPTPTGFTVRQNALGSNGDTYIYVAIRRGPMAVPESATDVFDVVTRTGDATVRSTVPVNISVVDSVLNLTRSGSEAQCLGSRIAGNTFMFTNTSQAEVPISKIYWDYSDSFAWDDNNGNLNSSTYVDYAFKRAPNFFDVVAYSGNNTAGNAISHNLGVVPEMMWIKSRSNAVSWIVYHKDLNGGTNPEDYYLILNGTNAETNDSTGDYFNSTAPTATNFTLGGSYWVNGTSNIAYLFASLAGISKVGSYTGNGTSQTIDCGFTSGARFVLIKRTNGTGNWIVFDTARGIVSGTDPQLFLNTTDAEDTGHDLVDPASSGFVVNNDNTAFSYQEVNANGAEYIFYAIA